MPSSTQTLTSADAAILGLMDWLPATARRILEVGCGAGRFGQEIRSRRSVEIHGIEADQDAAGVARQRLDRVAVGDLETTPTWFGENSYDAIVCREELPPL